MVLPLAQAGDERGTQRLTVLEATPGGIVERTLDAVRFVPLLSGTGVNERAASLSIRRCPSSSHPP